MRCTHFSAIVHNCSSFAARRTSARCRSWVMWKICRNSSSSLAFGSLSEPWARKTLIMCEYDSSSAIKKGKQTDWICNNCGAMAVRCCGRSHGILCLLSVSSSWLRAAFHLPRRRSMPRHSSRDISNVCGHILRSVWNSLRSMVSNPLGCDVIQ